MLTSAQHSAIHHHTQNLIVVAGAGSGKTYVLVERYLALLDAHPEWSLNALVAITFTKKAAQEMRDRVRQALENRYRRVDTDRELWAGRLASMDSARIDTIHGLCASILRANAAESGVDPGFQVLDEVESHLLLDDVIERTLQTLVREHDPAIHLLTEYDVRLVWRTIVDLIGFELPDVPNDLWGLWQTQWRNQAASLIETFQYQTQHKIVRHWHPEPDWPRNDRLFDVWNIAWANLDQLNRSNVTDSDGLDLCLNALHRLANEIKLNVGSPNAWGGKERFQEIKAALKTLREAAAGVLETLGASPAEADAKAAELLPLWVRLIQRIQAAYWQAKQGESLIDFDDLERLCHRLLQNPLVQTRYRDAEFKHILVDEFQDTNHAQWEIIQSLADLNRAGSIFVVGDPKQSIYQFRGADVSVFEQVRGKILGADGRDVALSRSFRTHHPLVEGFNAIFGRILVKNPDSPVRDYEVELGEAMQAERSAPPSDEPVLEFILISKDILPDGEDSAENRRRWEAYEIARRLQQIVEVEKRLIFDKAQQIHRPIGYGDIAILFQSTSNIILYEDVFKARSLPFVTVAGRGYYSRQEVWDLLNLLTALHNPGDNLSLATALRSPLFGLSDDALLALRLVKNEHGEPLGLWQALDTLTAFLPDDEIDRVTFARDCLYRLRSLAGRITIAELLRQIVDQTGYLAVLTGLPDGARRRGNVEKLIEKAEASGQVTLGAFSRYVRDLSAREVREGEALVDVKDAITLMTVHASKGLEYPLVVLVDVGWSRQGGDNTAVMLDPQLGLTCKVYDPLEEKLVSGYAHAQAEHLSELRQRAERKRLLYVAVTRAQDYLLITGQLQSEGKESRWKTTTWLGWLWDALDFDNQDFTSGVNLLDGYSWGRVRVTIPDQSPPEESLIGESDTQHSAWSLPAVQSGQPLSDEIARPDLIGEIKGSLAVYARHLTATQIADLGAAKIVEEPPFYLNRLRRQVLDDAPAHIDRVTQDRVQGVSQRVIGEIVHKALGNWRFPSDADDRDALLQSYAWELGVVHPGQRQYAAQEARKLLLNLKDSDIYAWIASARTIYREIPFVYRTDHRIIHGILDVLLQTQEGEWRIVDYKTSYVEGYKPGRDQQLLIEHARRYHLQVGVYAAAVREQLGEVTPEVYIHYIRYGQTVRIETEAWRAALEALETTIGDLLAE